MTFSRSNTIVGWLLFVLSTIVYVLTLEPSVSFWDCGEWISVAHGLQVGHPPGAPLYILLAKIFSLFSFGNVSLVAYCVNLLSAVASGLTIMFLFWTATYFIKLLFSKMSKKVYHDDFIVLLSAAVGALVYTFSHTFWSSAVEAEVYALSSLFSAIIVWAATKCVRSQHYASRWLLLICFLIGISYSVHNLSLLVLPAIVMFFYYKYCPKPSFLKSCLAFVASVAVLAIVFLGLIPGMFYFMAEVSKWLVNSLEMSVLASVGCYFLILFIVMTLGITLSVFAKRKVLHFVFLSLSFMLIGLSLQCVTMFCSISMPPINELEPSNPKVLYSYIQRDNYEKAPLLYGPYYSAPFDSYTDGKPEYDIVYLPKRNSQVVDTFYSKADMLKYLAANKDADIVEQYMVVDDGSNKVSVFDKKFYTFFPRMWKVGEPYAHNYYSWTNGTGTFVDYNGDEIYLPSFFDNVTFFVNYQLGYMYFRYFIDNFAGDSSNTSSPFLVLPFVLGLLGIVFHFAKDGRNFIVVLVLFFFTSIALVVYLNQPAYEPRERDYVYAVSFYAYSIWIAMGVAAVFAVAYRFKFMRNTIATILLSVFMLSVPAVMAVNNWDSHDRSGQYLPHDIAYNFLQSCPKNAILFTNGDNDTFPLWYLQQVEKVRTDVRIINLSLLHSPWYIAQMAMDNTADSTLHLSFDKKDYAGNRLELLLCESADRELQWTDVAAFLKTDYAKAEVDDMPAFYIIPTNEITLTVNDDILSRPRNVDINLPQVMMRNMLMHLDIIISNYHSRPICYTDYALDEIEILDDYLQMEGMVYRLNLNEKPNYRSVNTYVFYNNVLKYRWGNIEGNRQISGVSKEMRDMMVDKINTLYKALQEQGDYDKADSLKQYLDINLPTSMLEN